MSILLRLAAFTLLSLLCFKAESPYPVLPAEICDNAIDDDQDDLIDIQDPDCECTLIEPISRIPNPSFEDQSCCPASISQLVCAETWIQASAPTTDYLHTCGWMGWDGLPPPLPFPDGEAAVGFRDGRVIQDTPEPWWKEYVGACLLAPLLEGVPYRIEFFLGFTDPENSPPIAVTFFGSTDCENLPFGNNDETFGCPTNGPGWKLLGSVSLSGSNQWIQTRIDIVPREDIYAIAIGPACPDRPATEPLYYFIDNLVLDEKSVFDFQISPEQDNPCAENFSLRVPDADSLSYQWYKEGVALLGETNATLKVKTGPGDYQVRVSGGSGCKITNVYKYRRPVERSFTTQYLCEGRSLQFGSLNLDQSGTYWDTLKSAANCDSIIQLELVDAYDQQKAVNAKIFESENYAVDSVSFDQPGVYPVLLTSKEGCDSLVILRLDYYKVYTPNAFSPNGDGINDYFSVMGGEDLIAIQSLNIFDKWGNQIFSKDNLTPNRIREGWDGSFHGKPVMNGTYIYTTELLMDDGQVRRQKGSLLLMR